MKFLKVKFGLFSVLAVFAVSVFMTSCEQNTIDIPNIVESDVDELSSFDHDKDIEILSENGLNKATITVSGSDQSLLEEIKQGDFKIIPIFEHPTEVVNQTDDRSSSISEDTEASEGGMPVGLTVSNVELEEGAIGYSIDVNRTNYSRAVGYDWWYSTSNKVRVKTTAGCTTTTVFRKYNCSNNYARQLSSYRCANGIVSYNGGNSCRLKVKISFNTNNYTWYRINFWN